MNVDLLVPQNINDYLNNFNRKAYDKTFGQYCDGIAGFMNELESCGNLRRTAEELVDQLDARVKGLFKKRQICDLEYFLMEYTGPAALKFGTEKSRAFAEALCEVWGQRRPDARFQLATYELFRDNFSNAIFGIKMNWGDK